MSIQKIVSTFLSDDVHDTDQWLTTCNPELLGDNTEVGVIAHPTERRLYFSVLGKTNSVFARRHVGTLVLRVQMPTLLLPVHRAKIVDVLNRLPNVVVTSCPDQAPHFMLPHFMLNGELWTGGWVWVYPHMPAYIKEKPKCN